MTLKLAVVMTADSRNLEKGADRSEKAINEIRKGTIAATKSNKQYAAQVIKMGRESSRATDTMRKGFKDLTTQQKIGTKAAISASNANKQFAGQVIKMGRDGNRATESMKKGFKDLTTQQRISTKATIQQTILLKNAFDQMGKDGMRMYKGVTREVRNLKREIKSTSQTQSKATQQATSGLMKVKSALGPIGLAIAATFGGLAMVTFADQMTNSTNQLKLAVSGEKELIATRAALLNLSNKGRTDLIATTQLYARLARATKELDINQGDLLNVTDTINKSFVLSGASVQEQEGAIRQLSQALASGVFRGEEFNSVAEQGPRLMQALSDETGKSAAELRKLAAEGKLTSEVLIAALINQSDKIDAEFAKTESTVGQSTVVMMNSIKSLIGVMNDATGATGFIAGGFLNVADSFTSLKNSIESGQIGGFLDAWVSEFTEGFKIIGEDQRKFIDEIKGLGSIIADFVGDATDTYLQMWRYFPIYTKAGIKALGIELSSLLDLVPLYAKTFKNNFIAEINELIANLGALGQKIYSVLNVFDDEGFDLTSVVIANGLKYQAQADAANVAANAEIEIAKAARKEKLSIIESEVNASKKRFEQAVKEAQTLRQVYEDNAAAIPESGAASVAAVNMDATGGVTTDQLEELRQSLLNEEQLRSEHLQRRIDMINTAAQHEQLVQGDEVANRAKAAELIRDQVSKHNDEVEALQRARTMNILSSSEQLFGGLAGLAKSFGGEQSKAFRVMFAVQKGFAIAQGIMNLTTAISQASILTFPTNIPAMATAASTGATLVANLKSSNYQGQAHDGLMRVPAANEGTYTLRKDEMVLNPKQRDNFDKMRQSYERGATVNNRGAGYQYTFSPTFIIDAQNGVDEAKVRQQVEQQIGEYDQVLQEDLASNGPRAQLLGGRAA
jgi:tape measure domain-containing protein